MNKASKFSPNRNRLLFCSDLHINHNPNWKTPPLWKSRGFKDIAEHDSWIRDEWHKHVDANTIVFNLGDVTFTDPDGSKFRQLTNWPGQQFLLNGNHWSGQKQIYEEELLAQAMPTNCRRYPLNVNNLIFLGDQFLTFIGSQSVYMQHYAPFIWPEMSGGGFALCGHSHGNCNELNVDDKEFGKILDVGVDNAIKYNGTPFFTWDEINRIMNSKPIRKSDHH